MLCVSQGTSAQRLLAFCCLAAECLVLCAVSLGVALSQSLQLPRPQTRWQRRRDHHKRWAHLLTTAQAMVAMVVEQTMVAVEQAMVAMVLEQAMMRWFRLHRLQRLQLPVLNPNLLRAMQPGGRGRKSLKALRLGCLHLRLVR